MHGGVAALRHRGDCTRGDVEACGHPVPVAPFRGPTAKAWRSDAQDIEFSVVSARFKRSKRAAFWSLPTERPKRDPQERILPSQCLGGVMQP